MCIRDSDKGEYEEFSATKTKALLASQKEPVFLQDKPLLSCLLYTSDAADERSSVDLGGRRLIKKKTNTAYGWRAIAIYTTEMHNT